MAVFRLEIDCRRLSAGSAKPSGMFCPLRRNGLGRRGCLGSSRIDPQTWLECAKC